jgi:hypothetical protein
MARLGWMIVVVALGWNAAAFAQTGERRCSVPPFYGATSATGAVATMHVVNDGHACGFHMLSRGSNVESVTITEPPAHGKIEVEGAAVRYTPAAGYVGKDQFRAVSSASHKVLMQVDVVAR